MHTFAHPHASNPKFTNDPNAAMSRTVSYRTDDAAEHSPWCERLNALRNIPPVLRILWDSGPSVVASGLSLRLVIAVLPFAIAKVAQYIVTDIANHLHGEALPANFW